LRVTVEIQSLDAEGAGVGLAGEDALEVHVPGTAPGDRILAQVQHVSPHKVNGQKRAWAQLISIERASPERQTPACAAFGQCGGCAVAHVSIARQEQWKHAQLVASLGTAGVAASVIAPVIASPRSEGYRNQSKLVVGRERSGNTVLGAYAPRSHDVVDTAGCALVEPPLQHVADTLRRLVFSMGITPYDETTGGGELRYVVLRANHREEVLVTLVVPAEGPRIVELAVELMSLHPEVVGVIANLNSQPGDALMGSVEKVIAGVGVLQEAILNTTLTLSSRTFFQVNRGVAAALYEAVRERVKEFAERQSTPVVMAEVYAGVGVIASELQPLAAQVIAIENNPAVSAHYPPERGITLAEADAAIGLSQVAEAGVVVLNPPRAGCEGAVLAQVLRLRPGLLCYVSCNPKSLARDLRVLQAGGYRVMQVLPFDMMPHTPHVETLVFLTPGDA